MEMVTGTATDVAPPKRRSKTESATIEISGQGLALEAHAREELWDLRGKLNAINKSMAIIEFNTDGTVITANDNFLEAMGYRLDEIRGRHHRMFVDPSYASSADYRRFWAELNAGKYRSDEFRRLNKDGGEVWIQATYNPIFSDEGRLVKVVKFASDVTETKRKALDNYGQVLVISRVMAVIEFQVDGSILTANDNFLNAMGYRLDEIKGKHHRIFMSPDAASSQEYRQFWQDLAAGRFQAGEFCRIGKSGREVWIQASYNPILDDTGKVLKVVKFATDITATKQLQRDIAAAAEREANSASDLRTKVDHILATVNAAARGDLSHELKVSGNDAIGQLAQGLNGFLSELRKNMSSIAQSSQLLSASAAQMSTVSAQMGSAASETASKAKTVASASDEISHTVQTVASSTDEMSASIKEIAKSANDSARVAVSAVQMAQNTNQTVNRLGASSEEIGKVIRVITGIAQQTKLLALNATIEAARAGESG